jgi:hypothetical protein
MENQTAFELNLAIQRWRENLAQSSAFRDENLNELESHLRDSIATLQSGALSDEEAFVIAIKRIGSAGALEQEFGKMNRNALWLERLLWMLIGVQAWMLVNGVAGSITENLLMFGWRTHSSDMSPALSISAVTFVRTAVVIATAGFCWWLMIRKGGGFGRWFEMKLQRRLAFLGWCVAACLLLLIVQTLSIFFQLYWVHRIGLIMFSERTTYLSYSQVITRLLQFLAMIVFILVLARRRLVSKIT